MRHSTLGRVARSSGPGPVRPADRRIAPHAQHRGARIRRPGICPNAPRTSSVLPVGICPNRAEAVAQSRRPTDALRVPSLKPSRATPSAFVRLRAGDPSPNPPDRTCRPRRTPICPIRPRPRPPSPRPRTLTAAPRRLHPRPASGICPNAPSARGAPRPRTTRACCDGGARRTGEEPVTPPSARPTRRPGLRPPACPCPLPP